MKSIKKLWASVTKFRDGSASSGSSKDDTTACRSAYQSVAQLCATRSETPLGVVPIAPLPNLGQEVAQYHGFAVLFEGLCCVYIYQADQVCVRSTLEESPMPSKVPLSLDVPPPSSLRAHRTTSGSAGGGGGGGVPIRRVSSEGDLLGHSSSGGAGSTTEHPGSEAALGNTAATTATGTASDGWGYDGGNSSFGGPGSQRDDEEDYEALSLLEHERRPPPSCRRTKPFYVEIAINQKATNLTCHYIGNGVLLFTRNREKLSEVMYYVLPTPNQLLKKWKQQAQALHGTGSSSSDPGLGGGSSFPLLRKEEGKAIPLFRDPSHSSGGKGAGGGGKHSKSSTTSSSSSSTKGLAETTSSGSGHSSSHGSSIQVALPPMTLTALSFWPHGEKGSVELFLLAHGTNSDEGQIVRCHFRRDDLSMSEGSTSAVSPTAGTAAALRLGPPADTTGTAATVNGREHSQPAAEQPPKEGQEEEEESAVAARSRPQLHQDPAVPFATPSSSSSTSNAAATCTTTATTTTVRAVSVTKHRVAKTTKSPILVALDRDVVVIGHCVPCNNALMLEEIVWSLDHQKKVRFQCSISMSSSGGGSGGGGDRVSFSSPIVLWSEFVVFMFGQECYWIHKEEFEPRKLSAAGGGDSSTGGVLLSNLSADEGQPYLTVTPGRASQFTLTTKKTVAICRCSPSDPQQPHHQQGRQLTVADFAKDRYEKGGGKHWTSLAILPAPATLTVGHLGDTDHLATEGQGRRQPVPNCAPVGELAALHRGTGDETVFLRLPVKGPMMRTPQQQSLASLLLQESFSQMLSLPSSCEDRQLVSLSGCLGSFVEWSKKEEKLFLWSRTVAPLENEIGGYVSF